MKIRPYRREDLEPLVRVFHAAVHQLAAGHYTPEQLMAWAPDSPDVARWQQRLAGLQVLVMEHDGSMAGFIGYEHDGHLDLLFTNPKFARRGVAGALCSAAEAELARKRVPAAFVEVSRAARLFFERRGYTVERSETVAVRSEELERFRMRKLLCPLELPIEG